MKVSVVAFIISVFFASPTDIDVDRTELNCLAENVYHEARGESFLGMLAVGRVVQNRVSNIRFPSTYCAVVRQGPVFESWKTKKDKTLRPEQRIFYPVRFKCQFSWYCDGKSDHINKVNNLAWDISLRVATMILDNEVSNFLDGSTYYHNDNVQPNWKLERVAKINSHIFYRIPRGRTQRY